jgi:hypothetical protein
MHERMGKEGMKEGMKDAIKRNIHFLKNCAAAAATACRHHRIPAEREIIFYDPNTVICSLWVENVRRCVEIGDLQSLLEEGIFYIPIYGVRFWPDYAFSGRPAAGQSAVSEDLIKLSFPLPPPCC